MKLLLASAFLLAKANADSPCSMLMLLEVDPMDDACSTCLMGAMTFDEAGFVNMDYAACLPPIVKESCSKADFQVLSTLDSDFDSSAFSAIPADCLRCANAPNLGCSTCEVADCLPKAKRDGTECDEATVTAMGNAENEDEDFDMFSLPDSCYFCFFDVSMEQIAMENATEQEQADAFGVCFTNGAKGVFCDAAEADAEAGANSTEVIPTWCDGDFSGSVATAPLTGSVIAAVIAVVYALQW